MNERLRQLAGRLTGNGLDAFLVTQSTNIRYLTHFPAEESWLLVTQDKAYYLTDFRYILLARKGLKGITVCQVQTSMTKAVSELLSKHKVRRLGFDDRHITLFIASRLRRHLPHGVKLKVVRSLVEDSRAVKDPTELSLIRQAIEVNLELFQYLKRVVRPGLTEAGVLAKMESFIRDRHLAFSFSPIVASGPNSCYPHARVTQRRLRANDVVLIDAGIDVKGYKSDLTRMFFLGKIAQSFREIYDSVALAQQQAIRSIRPGIETKFVDQQARNVLKNKKLDKYFGHALGHGVGLEIHEKPSLSPKSTSTLNEGMVVTVEPAVYIPNRFGIRIEDMVLVTKRGFKLLSRNDDFD